MSRERAVKNFVTRFMLVIGFALGVMAGRWLAAVIVAGVFLVVTIVDLVRVGVAESETP